MSLIKSFLDALKALADASVVWLKQLRATPEERKTLQEQEADARIEREKRSGRPDNSFWK